MNSQTALAINAADGNQQAIQLASALKHVVDTAKATGTYEELFLRHRDVALTSSRRASDKIEKLLTTGLLTKTNDGRLISNVMLHVNPHSGLVELPDRVGTVLIATDWPDVSLDQQDPFDGREMVFPLHYESFALLEGLAKPQTGRASPTGSVLDIFCGSGVLGIYAARLGLGPVWFADLSARTLAFARLNAHLNGVNAAAFVQSDLFDKLPARTRWEWILANPPFEAVPETSKGKYFIHSYGGASGQEQMTQLLKKAPARLTETGTILSVDFILDGQGDEWRASLKRDLQQWLRPPFYGRLSAFDQIELRDFWQRYEILGIDPRRESLSRKLSEGNSSLLLCTLEVSNELTKHEVVPRDRPCGAFWQNPLQWPLPCGVTLDEASLKHWRSASREWEAEKLADEAAILAEAMGNFEGEVGYWDFTEALDTRHPRYEEASNRMLRGALVATLNDAQHLLLAGVMLPQHVSLFILPPLTSGLAPDASMFEVTAPQQRRPWEKTRGQLFHESAWKYIKRLDGEEFDRWLKGKLTEVSTVFFRFGIVIPERISSNARLADLQEYKQLATGRLVGLEENGKRPNVSGLLTQERTEAQAYLLCIDLGEQGLSTLRSAELVWGKDWRKQLEEQCFRFLRDRLTLLAIPMVVARERAKDAEKKTSRHLALTFQHEFNGTSDNIQRRLSKLWKSGGPLTEQVVKDIEGRLNFISVILESLDCLSELDAPSERKESFGIAIKGIHEEIKKWDDFTLQVTWEDDSRAESVLVPGSFRFAFAELLRNAYKYSTQPTSASVTIRRKKEQLILVIRNRVTAKQSSQLLDDWRKAKEREGQSPDPAKQMGLPILLLICSRWGSLDYQSVVGDSEIQATLTINLERP